MILIQSSPRSTYIRITAYYVVTSSIWFRLSSMQRLIPGPHFCPLPTKTCLMEQLRQQEPCAASQMSLSYQLACNQCTTLRRPRNILCSDYAHPACKLIILIIYLLFYVNVLWYFHTYTPSGTAVNFSDTCVCDKLTHIM